LLIAVVIIAISINLNTYIPCYIHHVDFSKQTYKSQIDPLSKKLDNQDERFDQIEFKVDHLIRAFEKSPM